MSEQLSVEVSIDDTRYNERVQFSSNSSKTFFLFTDFALGMNASLSRFALQLSNIGLADFGYTAQLAFRSAVATSIGSNFTHDAVTIESFALASSAWDADSATRRRLSTELRLTVRFQIHAETVPDFAVNISHLRAAGAGLEFVTSISETAVLTSSTTVKPRRAPAHTTSDWRVTVLAPGIVEGLHDPPMVRFGDWMALMCRSFP